MYFRFGNETDTQKKYVFSKPLKYLILATLSVYFAEGIVLIFAFSRRLAEINNLPTEWQILVKIVSPLVTAYSIYFLAKKWRLHGATAFSLLIFIIWIIGFNFVP